MRHCLFLGKPKVHGILLLSLLTPDSVEKNCFGSRGSPRLRGQRGRWPGRHRGGLHRQLCINITWHHKTTPHNQQLESPQTSTASQTLATRIQFLSLLDHSVTTPRETQTQAPHSDINDDEHLITEPRAEGWAIDCFSRRTIQTYFAERRKLRSIRSSRSASMGYRDGGSPVATSYNAERWQSCHLRWEQFSLVEFGD